MKNNNDENIFIHSEWTDTCILKNNKIYRTSNKDIGKFYYDNNKIIVNWKKSNDNDIFINMYNCYYHIIFFNKYINNYNIELIDLYFDKIKTEFIINKDLKIIIDKYNLTKIGNCILDNKYFIIKWNKNNDDYDEIFFKIHEKYYNKNYLSKLINDDLHTENNHKYLSEQSIDKELFYTNSDSETQSETYSDFETEIPLEIDPIHKSIKEIFKKKNNKFYLVNEIKYKYNIFNVDLKKNSIIKNLSTITKNINIKNINYINKENIDNYINAENNRDNNECSSLFPKELYSKNNLDEILKIELDFEIPLKTKKRILSLVEWGYPPFGGGENWLLNLNNFFYKNNYDNYLICFSDPFKNEYFSEIQLIDLKYVKIIQMPKNLLSIIKLIKLINPDIINHQGVYREYFMQISNVLEIPFLTGFCFWNNIIDFNTNNLNIDMINNNDLSPTIEFNNILKYSYTYASSNFVNDIIDKFYGIKLDVIESISIKEEFYIDKNLYNDNLNYVTLINCHYNKCGHIIEYLCENLDIDIPLQIIYTENDPNISSEYVTKLIENRNLKKNINILSLTKINIKDIYNKTRILLIPYLCDETFCRVAYEGMVNKLPILSTKNGNLKYLLQDYAKFIDGHNHSKWKKTIESMYFNINALQEYNNKKTDILSETIISNKITDKLNEITESKYKLTQNNIGMIVPWADQGLGIQSRDYYISLKELGYEPHIFSFKPYHATHENILLQSNKEEWLYDNIHYSNNYREDITYDEIFNFVYKYNIKTIIIIEATFLNIFKIAAFLKILNINVYLVINIECIRLIELEYHSIFDKILTNNNTSNKILSYIFKNNVSNLGFHLNYPYFQKKIKLNKINLNKIKFCCIGGLNSISRKNIDLVIKAFYEIYNEYKNKINYWELNVYIQGVEIPSIVEKYKCNNINYFIHNNSYRSIIDKYFENDIFIHMGSHEGLGLGYYEALYSGCPIIIMDWIPGNEIIKDKINGWYIKCSYNTLNDNNNSLINRGIINKDDIVDKIIEILDDNKTLDIINNTIDNIKFLYNKNKKIFNKNLLDFLQ